MFHKNTAFVPTERVIALYNADRAELVGLFDGASILSRYIYGQNTKNGNIASALRNRHRLRTKALGYSIALRYANENQKKIIGSDKYKILNGYPEPANFRIACANIENISLTHNYNVCQQ